MKGAFIVEYIGELVTAQQADRREELDSSVFRYYFLYKNKKCWWVCTEFVMFEY